MSRIEINRKIIFYGICTERGSAKNKVISTRGYVMQYVVLYVMN